MHNYRKLSGHFVTAWSQNELLSFLNTNDSYLHLRIWGKKAQKMRCASGNP